MQLVPEWAPNIHPMIVHFPIALIFTAVVVDVIDLFLRPRRWLRITTLSLYGVGAVAAIVTYFTGKSAADAVMLPAAAQSVLTDHSGWALWTVWFFGLYAAARLLAFWLDRKDHVLVHAAFALVALAGLYLPYQTGDHGAMMVFKYGVGVQAAEIEDPVQHDHGNHEGSGEGESGDSEGADAHGEGAGHDEGAGMDGEATGPQVAESGAWRWTPGANAAQALHGGFAWLSGSADALQPATASAQERGEVLKLQAGGQPAMFTAGGSLESIQADARLNLSGFEGTAMIVHHVQDAENYDFAALEPSGSGSGTMRLGRVRGGEMTVSDEGTYAQDDWLPVRVVSDKDHYRGYVGQELVAHGHGSAPEPGPVGLRLDGTGTVLVGRLEVQSLR